MMEIFIQHPLLLFCLVIIGTVIAVRVSLWAAPNLNIYIGKHNVHHLYTGAVLLIVGAILLIQGIQNIYTVTLTGVATGLILDELGYLVSANVGDKAYFSRKSRTQMFFSVCITLLFTLTISTLLG